MLLVLTTDAQIWHPTLSIHTFLEEKDCANPKIEAFLLVCHGFPSIRQIFSFYKISTNFLLNYLVNGWEHTTSTIILKPSVGNVIVITRPRPIADPPKFYLASDWWQNIKTNSNEACQCDMTKDSCLDLEIFFFLLHWRTYSRKRVFSTVGTSYTITYTPPFL